MALERSTTADALCLELLQKGSPRGFAESSAAGPALDPLNETGALDDPLMNLSPTIRFPGGLPLDDDTLSSTMLADTTIPADSYVDDRPQPRRVWSFTCTRGRQGVTALTLPDGGAQVVAEKSMQTLMQTLSSAAAVHGNSFTWVPGETIGRGAMGVVITALNQTSGEEMAVKHVIIDRERESDLLLQESLMNELEICRSLRHPRIVSFLGHDFLDGSLYIYTEYMPGGSLTGVLQEFGPLDESLLTTFTREMVEGLDFLHGQEPAVLHRDIKGTNILVSLSCHVKLADFGCSKRTDEELAYTVKGSIPWMAPEVIQNVGYGSKADMWSLGCVVIEMATANKPWGKFDNVMAAMRIISMTDRVPPVPEHLSQSAKEFIVACVQRDPAQRPSASAALQDKFLNDLNVCDVTQSLC